MQCQQGLRSVNLPRWGLKLLFKVLLSYGEILPRWGLKTVKLPFFVFYPVRGIWSYCLNNYNFTLVGFEIYILPSLVVVEQ